MQCARPCTMAEEARCYPRIEDTPYRLLPDSKQPCWWSGRALEAAPAWCDSTLRDGNQAIPVPMSLERKLEIFRLLTREIGLSEVEVGFPASNETEYRFVRKLIEGDLIPDWVTIQVLTQARPELIKRTLESLRGARRAILHFYISTSPVQRKIVLRRSEAEIIEMAVQAARQIKAGARFLKEEGTELILEFSPESFTLTEPPYALAICQNVLETWSPTEEHPVILNLPATMEVTSPHHFAALIEWFDRRLMERHWRDRVIVSLHCHNDRGTAVAATEMGMLAGADRVEGTLFGNGERAGNACLVTLALNLLASGIDPELNLRNMPRIVEVYQRCTGMEVSPRHPYAGANAYTAYSGSHQDAITKYGSWYEENGPNEAHWRNPYIYTNPQHIGRVLEGAIRINNQSGRGGIGHVMQGLGYNLPTWLRDPLARRVKEYADQVGDEIEPDELEEVFLHAYDYTGNKAPFQLRRIQVETPPANGQGNGQPHRCRAELSLQDSPTVLLNLTGEGGGSVEAFVSALARDYPGLEIVHYAEHELGEGGAAAQAVAYIYLRYRGLEYCGVGRDSDTQQAWAKAVLAALNQAVRS